MSCEQQPPDAHARHWFRRYWTLGVGSGAHLLVNGLLDVTRELAEEQVTARVGDRPIWSVRGCNSAGEKE